MDILQRARDVIAQEAAAIASIEVDDNYEKVVRLILACDSKVITTGIGKAGLIAKKMAATLSSTGSPAVFFACSRGCSWRSWHRQQQ